MKAKLCSIAVALSFFFFLSAAPAFAQWRASVGAESNDMARQAAAFLPNEIWIHAGDSITWTFRSDEIHTITFLTPGQVRPPFAVGCPGFSLGRAVFDGSACVTTPPTTKGHAFTVTFPKAGNYKLVCLVHPDMTGLIHVLDLGAPLPHNQAFYDEQGADQRRDLLSDADRGQAEGQETIRGDGDPLTFRVIPHVTVGIGEVTATPGGAQTFFMPRFFKNTITIHAGDTVEWSNHDPVTPHTITFGADPPKPAVPSANVTVDADGARHAMVTSPTDNVHSGFIVAAPQERIGLPLSPPGVTRFRVTFTRPGTYPYRCVLHDNLGMVGKVVVLP
ncbi:MAG: cupredoxin domain-containing protein [Candidatus Acidiferrales bacterium]